MKLNTKHYILASFLRSYRNLTDHSLYPAPPFFAKFEPEFKKRLETCNIILSPSDDRPLELYSNICPTNKKIKGFCVFSDDRLVYIYTHFQQRRIGLGVEMVKLCFQHLRPREEVEVEFLTRVGLRFFESPKVQALVPNGFKVKAGR